MTAFLLCTESVKRFTAFYAVYFTLYRASQKTHCILRCVFYFIQSQSKDSLHSTLCILLYTESVKRLAAFYAVYFTLYRVSQKTRCILRCPWQTFTSQRRLRWAPVFCQYLVCHIRFTTEICIKTFLVTHQWGFSPGNQPKIPYLTLYSDKLVRNPE